MEYAHTQAVGCSITHTLVNMMGYYYNRGHKMKTFLKPQDEILFLHGQKDRILLIFESQGVMPE
jgi:hypothetical protein